MSRGDVTGTARTYGAQQIAIARCPSPIADVDCDLHAMWRSRSVVRKPVEATTFDLASSNMEDATTRGNPYAVTRHGVPSVG